HPVRALRYRSYGRIGAQRGPTNLGRRDWNRLGSTARQVGSPAAMRRIAHVTICLCLAPDTSRREVFRWTRGICALTRWFPQDLQNFAVRREPVSYPHRLLPPWT